MRNRIEPISKIVCIALGALLLVQIVRGVIRSNPLAKVNIPAVPTLGGTNAPDSKTTNAAPKLLAQSSTNSATNSVKAVGTNVSVAASVAGTNAVATNAPAPKPVVPTEVSLASATVAGTNRTNVSVAPTLVSESTSNSMAQATKDLAGTNSVAVTGTNAPGTNAVVRTPSPRPSGPRPNMAMAG
ncbi:MAG TPA: hypothetical protein VK327_12375, partial [Candidatus Paceibacterota bacterium]|nr:hypothetical protein [Candidatus Paceibacterota bacterium]